MCVCLGCIINLLSLVRVLYYRMLTGTRCAVVGRTRCAVRSVATLCTRGENGVLLCSVHV